MSVLKSYIIQKAAWEDIVSYSDGTEFEYEGIRRDRLGLYHISAFVYFHDPKDTITHICIRFVYSRRELVIYLESQRNISTKEKWIAAVKTRATQAIKKFMEGACDNL